MTNALHPGVGPQTITEPLELEVNSVGLDRTICLNLVQSNLTYLIFNLHVAVISAEVQVTNWGFKSKNLLEFHETVIVSRK